jgi:hypothetical protein
VGVGGIAGIESRFYEESNKSWDGKHD